MNINASHSHRPKPPKISHALLYHLPSSSADVSYETRKSSLKGSASLGGGEECMFDSPLGVHREGASHYIDLDSALLQ